MASEILHRYEIPVLSFFIPVTHIGVQLEIICADRCASDILEERIVTPSPTPTIHISCAVLSSDKSEFSFTAQPNPYNGFDRVSNFPVTVYLNNPRWSEDSKKVLTPIKGSVVKITGTISSVHIDEDGVNHWIVTASEIYFLKDSLPISKPAVPGTGEAIFADHRVQFLTPPSKLNQRSPERPFRTQMCLHLR